MRKRLMICLAADNFRLSANGSCYSSEPEIDERTEIGGVQGCNAKHEGKGRKTSCHDVLLIGKL